jgi:hypothetical protein
MSALDLGLALPRRAPAGLCCCAACCAFDPSRIELRTPPAAEIFARLRADRRRCHVCGRHWRRGDDFCWFCKNEKGETDG